MAKKILLLGHTGKLGRALVKVLAQDFMVVAKSSKECDVCDFQAVEDAIKQVKPDILVNATSVLGVEGCEEEPQKAFSINTLLPKQLAELSNAYGFLLVHFTTDAVFDGSKKDFYTEQDAGRPLNIYGLTKYGGERFLQVIAKRYYLFRISLLFGETAKINQFVEKMLEKIKQGASILRISDDVVISPSYSLDIAQEVKRILFAELPYGLYHIANEGQASLYELISEICLNLNLKVKVEKASHKEFHSAVAKNMYGPIRSDKIKPLRSWKEAVKDYCALIRKDWEGYAK